MTVEEMLIQIVGRSDFAEEEPMSAHCSFKTGGPADWFVTPKDENQLKELIQTARRENIPYMILGNGSNVLVSDQGIEGLVIYLGKHFNTVEIKGEEMTVEAGALLSKAAISALEHGLAGLEFAGGIPGSFGGAVYMNAGAYGGEMKQVLKEVTVLTKDLEIITIPAEKLALGYRTSIIGPSGYILLNGKVKLKKGSKEAIKELMNDYNGRRREKQPLNFPSAGSTFKRPQGYFAGKLIEDSGLKGYSVGGAQVSEKHAGFVINKGNATTADILAVIEHCQKTVYEKFGIHLECEVRKIGRF